MRSDKLKKFSWQERRMSFVCALRGIQHVVRTQHNAWIHGVATLAVALLGIAFRISNTEWCCLVICLSIVWTAEALNTALELLTDIVSPDFHPLAGRSKDVAAGAVLMASVGAGLVGAIVFGPYLAKLIAR